MGDSYATGVQYILWKRADSIVRHVIDLSEYVETLKSATVTVTSPNMTYTNEDQSWFGLVSVFMAMSSYVSPMDNH